MPPLYYTVIEYGMKGFEMMVNKKILFLKTFVIFMIFILMVWYLAINANLALINIRLFQSLIYFLNDMNSRNNILEYVALLIIKLLFNVDIHNLQSFFDNINPLIN